MNEKKISKSKIFWLSLVIKSRNQIDATLSSQDRSTSFTTYRLAHGGYIQRAGVLAKTVTLFHRSQQCVTLFFSFFHWPTLFIHSVMVMATQGTGQTGLACLAARPRQSSPSPEPSVRLCCYFLGGVWVTFQLAAPFLTFQRSIKVLSLNGKNSHKHGPSTTYQ